MIRAEVFRKAAEYLDYSVAGVLRPAGACVAIWRAMGHQGGFKPHEVLFTRMYKERSQDAKTNWLGDPKDPANQELRRTLLLEAALCIEEQFPECK